MIAEREERLSGSSARASKPKVDSSNLNAKRDSGKGKARVSSLSKENSGKLLSNREIGKSSPLSWNTLPDELVVHMFFNIMTGNEPEALLAFKTTCKNLSQNCAILNKARFSKIIDIFLRPTPQVKARFSRIIDIFLRLIPQVENEKQILDARKEQLLSLIEKEHITFKKSLIDQATVNRLAKVLESEDLEQARSAESFFQLLLQKQCINPGQVNEIPWVKHQVETLSLYSNMDANEMEQWIDQLPEVDSPVAFLLPVSEVPSALEKLLRHADARVRCNAAWALGEMAEEGLLKEAPKGMVSKLQALLKDDDADVRGNAISALREMGEDGLLKEAPKGMVSQLQGLLKDADADVRFNAALILWETDGNGLLKDGVLPTIIFGLLRLLRDGDLCTKLSAACALVYVSMEVKLVRIVCRLLFLIVVIWFLVSIKAWLHK